MIGAGSGGFKQDQAKTLILDELNEKDQCSAGGEDRFVQESETVTIPIESLVNLGPKSSQWLRDAGISTMAELEEPGAVAAFQLV